MNSITQNRSIAAALLLGGIASAVLVQVRWCHASEIVAEAADRMSPATFRGAPRAVPAGIAFDQAEEVVDVVESLRREGLEPSACDVGLDPEWAPPAQWTPPAGWDPPEWWPAPRPD